MKKYFLFISFINYNKIIFLSVFFLIFPSFLSFASDWPMYRGNPAHTSSTDEIIELPLEKKWEYNVPNPIGGDNSSVKACLVVYNDKIYIPTSKELISIDVKQDPSNVKPNWIKEEYKPAWGGVTGGNGKIFIPTNKYLYAIEENGTDTPTVKWKHSVENSGGACAITFTSEDNRLYFFTNDGKLHCLEDMGNSYKNLWIYSGEKSNSLYKEEAPTVVNKTIYVISDKKEITIIDSNGNYKKTLTNIANYKHGGESLEYIYNLSIVGDYLYFVATNSERKVGFTVCINKDTGDIKWKNGFNYFHCGYCISNNVLATTHSNHAAKQFVTCNATTGSTEGYAHKSENVGIYSGATATKEYIFFGETLYDNDLNVYSIKENKITELGGIDNWISTPIVIASKKIFVFSGKSGNAKLSVFSSSPAPSFAITMKANRNTKDNPSYPGDKIEYEINCENNGEDIATNVLIVSPIPANTTFDQGGNKNNDRVEWNIGELSNSPTDNKNKKTVKFTVIAGNVAEDTIVANTATISGEGKTNKKSYSKTSEKVEFLIIYNTPKILAVDPENKATNVLVNKKISIKFNIDMDVGTFTDENIRLKKGNIELAKEIEKYPKLSDKKTVELIPKENFEYDTEYTIEIDTGVKSMLGNKPLSVKEVFTFKTTPQLKVISVNVNEDVKVAIDTHIKVNFNVEVKENTVNNENIELYLQSTQKKVPGKIILESSKKVITFIPDKPLLEEEIYELKIKDLISIYNAPLEKKVSITFGTKKYQRSSNEPLINKSKIFAYPNPAKETDLIYFNYFLSKEADLTLKIFTLSGELIGEKTEKGYLGINYYLKYSIENLSSGLYIFSILAKTLEGEHEVATGKFVVIK